LGSPGRCFKTAPGDFANSFLTSVVKLGYTLLNLAVTIDELFLPKPSLASIAAFT
jgi:hypothetical protein